MKSEVRRREDKYFGCGNLFYGRGERLRVGNWPRTMRREQRSGQTGRDARRRDWFGGETTVKRASRYPRRKRGTKVSLLSATHYTWATALLYSLPPPIHHALPSFAANLSSKLLLVPVCPDSHPDPASYILQYRAGKQNFSSKLF